MFTRAGRHTLLCCGAVCGGGVRKGTMPLALLSVAFSHFPHFQQANWAPLVLIPRRVVCVHSRTLWVSPMNSPRSWEFLLPLQPPQSFAIRGFEALFPQAGTLGCVVCLAPQLFLPVYLRANVGSPDLPAATLLRVLSPLAAHLCPSFQSE